MVTANNPLLAGFYPDPSICRVGDDYYMVNSTFAYFPGLPIMHSRDLANWEQIGNALTTVSQLPLENAGISQGLFAPTIRYHEGIFYIICTNVSFGGNFVVTSKDPAGPWSEPHYIKGAEGIDPSLFFDDDGKCYYTGTHGNPAGEKFWGDNSIYIQEFDYDTFELKGERMEAWAGALKDVAWPEGPHLYKIDGYYYLMIAEGGTGPEHAVTVARSKEVFGPYEGCKRNPIFTHRHLGKRYPVQYVGHADIVDTKEGEYYMVMLAVRPINGLTTLGRETFIARVLFEDGWPLVNPGIGVLTDSVNIRLDEYKTETMTGSPINGGHTYIFTGMDSLGPEWLSLRGPAERFARFDGGLNLKCGKDLITGKGYPSYLGLRVNSRRYEIRGFFLNDDLTDGRSAGICLIQNEKYQVRFEVSDNFACVYLVRDGEELEVIRFPATQSPMGLGIMVEGLKANFAVFEGNDAIPIVKGLDISALSTEIAGGFVGCTAGMFAHDRSGREDGEAVFLRFDHRVLEKE